MVHIQSVDLSSRGVILPNDRVGMVIAQPYLSLSPAEPYRCTLATEPRQLQIITDTLNVALAAPHGVAKTHFTIFPEYSIPGAKGIALIETALSSAHWPVGTIIIGGTDAISKPDFVALAGGQGTHLDTAHNTLASIGPAQWINCAITWVKAADGNVERWLQPKLAPAGPELNIQFQDMFRGKSVFTFKGQFTNGTQYHFCSLVCFDWIATIDGQMVWRWVLDALGQQAAPNELSLSWVFVIQSNEKPSHDTYLTEVRQFFDQNVFPLVHRDRTCLVFANSGGKEVPGRADKYGSTSLIFSGQAQFDQPTCHPTFSTGGPRFRASNLLSPHKDVFFRERGACIHSFAQVNAGSLIAGASGRRYAVENAFVFPLNSGTDPRTPSAQVPACVKWLNDELDALHVRRLSAMYAAAPLAAHSDTTHDQSIGGLRKLSAQSATHTVKLAAQQSKAEHADQWESVESEALEHLVYTLDIMALGFPAPMVGADPAHATVEMDNQGVHLLAIRGASHEECIEHSKGSLPLRGQVLLVSRDTDNNPWRQKFGSFLQPESQQLGQERNITDPATGLLHLGYRNLLDVFRASGTAAAIRGAINAELAA